MTDTLTALDATFLELEDADASAHMHIGAVLTFDPLPDSGAPSIDEVRAYVASRLPALPRYRQRLTRDRVGRIDRPAWEEVPDFDVARQVRHATLPAPGRWDDLLEWAEDFYSQRLDRTGPLWEMVLVDGLADGGWALCTKTHHCLVDGIGSADVVQLLLDAEPHPRRSRAAAGPPPVSEDAAHAPSLARQAVRAGVDLATHPTHVGGVLERAAAVVDLIVRDELLRAPESSLNGPIGGRRRLRGTHIGLDQMRAISAQRGGTINDVALTAVTSGLRALLLARGEELPETGLRAMVPVNRRREDEQHDLGNRVTSLFVDLPVAEPTLRGRHAEVCANTRRLKESDQALGSDTIVKLAGITPPLLHSVIARSLFGKRLFNITVTNVPGSPVPLYALGARMRSVYPLVPLAADHALGVAIASYDGGLSIGVNADRDTVPDVDVFADALIAALDELARAD
jgi:WS/DGAT/MGAT family acyltransferase